MATRPRNVDLGPMYLPVGEQDADPGPAAAASGVETADVLRFKSLMQRHSGRQQETEVDADMLPSPLNAVDPSPQAETEDICAEIARLWVGTGLQGVREVRVGLRESLLPETSVRLYEMQGRLRIEFFCGKYRVADWLGGKLKALSLELGDSLEREVELFVYTGDGRIVASHVCSGEA